MIDQFKARRLSIDRISNLPCNVLDNILGRLQIREAVRTSMLSRKWRYKWHNLSKFLFDDLPWICPENTSVLAGFVYHVLLSHFGHIHTFKLFTYGKPECCDIDSWICFLARNGIRELTLMYGADRDHYKLPPSIFSCEQLTHLDINNDLPKPPATFKGFRNLVSLHLGGGNLTDFQLLERLIRNCSVLERLVLHDFQNPARFSIQAPNLKYLELQGRLGKIILENCPVLADITFIMIPDEFTSIEYREPGRICHLVHYLGHLSSLKSLKFSGHFLKHLPMWDVSSTSFTASNHLKDLKLEKIFLNHLGVVKVTLALLKLFSNLQELNISVTSNGYTKECFEVLDSRSQSSCSFDLLKIVKIHVIPIRAIRNADTNFSNRHVELELIKFLLSHSPILEKMTVVNDKPRVKSDIEFMRELLAMERASAEVKIAYYSKRHP